METAIQLRRFDLSVQNRAAAPKFVSEGDFD
jgi:hypothetical protein